MQRPGTRNDIGGQKVIVPPANVNMLKTFIHVEQS